LLSVTILWIGCLVAGITVAGSAQSQGGDVRKYPQRIVSLGPLNTENVFLLGAGDRVVGDTVYCDRPEQAKTLLKIGSVMQISIEKILSLDPDLVLATDLSPKLSLMKLQEAGIEVVKFGQARNFGEICEHFLELGRLLGLEAHAATVVAEARARVAAVQKKVAGQKKEKVFLQIGTTPLKGAIGASFTNDFIVFSGANNITGDQRTTSVDREKILSEDPDVILIAIMGNESELAKEEKLNWQHYGNLRAVRNNRIFLIHSDLVCSPSPITFCDALEQFARYIHPLLFSAK
jgi:iron complex transport system substrate-binding protein